MKKTAFISSLLIIMLLLSVTSCAAQSQPGQRIVKYQTKPDFFDAFIWPSKPPADCPFEQSDDIVGIYFTGQYATYTNADTWYPSWASDDNLYSPWTDGNIEGQSCWSGGDGAHTGQAKITGDDPKNLKVISLGTFHGSANPYGGRYPCGSLVYNGIWYHGSYCLDDSGWHWHENVLYNWPFLGPFVGFRISKDYGKTWTDCPHTPANPLFGEKGDRKGGPPVKIGIPHFVDFGKNMEHSPDGKAYLVCQGASADDPKPRFANLSWITADEIYLIRVKPSEKTINDLKAYEFFAGHDENGKAVWTKDQAKIKPLIDWNNNCGCVTMTYNEPLKKYIMCITDGWPTNKTMNTYILESDKITGPWKLCSYMKNFGVQAYFVNFPSKFFSKDGRTAWLCYSGNFTQDQRTNPPGGRYAMALQKLELLDKKNFTKYENIRKKNEGNPNYMSKYNKELKRLRENDQLKSDKNIAPKAAVTVSSISDGYKGESLVDRVVDGYPTDITKEWASKEEKAGAKVKLTWDKSYTINRIWLFDRPNTGYDQILEGKLTFSDGSTIITGELPNDATAGREIKFAPKKVDWLEFEVSKVRPSTLNIGLAEIAVFSP